MDADLIPAPPRAQSLTKEEYEDWVAQSVADQRTILAGLGEAKRGLWKAAEALYRFSENAGWLALGYESLGEWLADPDITMTQRTYHRMVSAWRELVVIRKLSTANVGSLDLTKVDIVLPAIKQGSVSLEDAISDVEVLGARDLRVKYTNSDQVAVGGGTMTPTGDGLPNEPPPNGSEPPIQVLSADEVFVKREVALILYGVLGRVMRELGAPERKAISNDLRNAITDAMIYARDEGVEFDG